MALSALRFVPGRLDWLLGSTGSARARWLGTLGLLAAALVLGLALLQAWQLRSLLAQREQRLGGASPPPMAQGSVATPPAPVLPAAEAARLNLIVRRLNTPWAAIFDSLERQTTPAATVLAVEPDVERGAIRIQTEGPGLDDLLRHAGQLQLDPRFAQVHLLRIDSPDAALPRRQRLSFDLVLAP